ncbi:DUF2301 domain-containing membrane protein [Spirulina subsalsa FACHB-351]|uniref:DUF2301 domain-containing membrane protein n=1 Tax=Spirulina subsalsa FACHB-351 TaxID=234711 RepID=A0ABT3L2E9_9CYAN|nr:DUF2301 domain-containing membrane protein [Spirulina subsalsa]MCW6035684.1 DUF2301 domain-containing membrane protein [Spirulina subsalsa FACHB-351]
MTTTTPTSNLPVYDGKFGPFTINPEDRRDVRLYRAGLAIAGLSFFLATTLLLFLGANPDLLPFLSLFYTLFSLGLGLSLLKIHIYLAPLHRLLKLFWIIGTVASFIFAYADSAPFALTLYYTPASLLGVGFTFAALTGIYFKEAFCFNRLETKILTPLVPLLLLGHLVGLLPLNMERTLLGSWAALFVIFVVRKLVQPIPPDIGDKSVFEHLKQGL